MKITENYCNYGEQILGLWQAATQYGATYNTGSTVIGILKNPHKALKTKPQDWNWAGVLLVWSCLLPY